MGFTTGMKGWTNTRKSSIIYHINKTNFFVYFNYITVSKNTGRWFDAVQHTHDKTSQQTRNRGILPLLIKGIEKNPILKIVVNGETKCFPLRHNILINISIQCCTRGPSQHNKARKGNQGIKLKRMK